MHGQLQRWDILNALRDTRRLLQPISFCKISDSVLLPQSRTLGCVTVAPALIATQCVHCAPALPASLQSLLSSFSVRSNPLQSLSEGPSLICALVGCSREGKSAGSP